MYRSLDDFLTDWRYESEATTKVLSNLTDPSLSQKVDPEGRSISQIAWHIATAPVEMLNHVGIKVDGHSRSEVIPNRAKDIASAYQRASASLGEQLKKNWSDKMLPEEIEIFRDKWSRGKFLHSLILHQAHHRGQMTVLMRQAGLKVPGVYGPSREEWSAMGAKPQQ
ncbi:MAG: DinB family protein [Bacteroidetes bacterium]|nr:DinB family protein [Bacteroidota bacterium]